MILYEYPLDERVRILLRLEDLFDKAGFFTAKNDPYEHHVALLTVFEILELASGANLKSDLLQELERQKQNLEALRGNPAVSADVLDNTLREIDRTSTRMFQMSGKTGQELRDNEWLMSIKQRTGLPGGVCEFDLPSYHYWLHQDAQIRCRDLQAWLAPFLPLRDGIAIVLRLLRDSGKTTRQMAPQGVFHQMQGTRPVRMLRLRLENGCACVPEISGNKYALNIRFTTQVNAQRPRPCDSDVEFELTYCTL